jgi:hypothetical protein
MVHPNEKGHQAYASAIYAYMLNKNHQPSSMPATPDPVTPGEKLATANQAQALAVQIAQLKSEAEQRGMEIDFETDRLGMDYRTFTAAQPLHCTEECAQDPQCEAYSYALPGTLGPEGRCWLKHEQPSPNRRPGFVSGAKVMVGKTMKLLEVNTDRPGMDYRSFEAANPKACQLACANETECKAFTFAPPGVVQAAGYCWLKSGRPDPIVNNRLVSGVKERTSDDFNYKDPGIELSTDRPGMDYRALETPQLQVCQLACLNDEQCKSFTFAPAGVVGATGYCWLKSGRPAPVVNNRLISGTKPLSADERRAK